MQNNVFDRKKNDVMLFLILSTFASKGCYYGLEVNKARNILKCPRENRLEETWVNILK